MRLFKNIMLFAAVATALFTSCETDVDTPQISTPESFVAPVIGQCSDVIVNADNSANENVIFTWTAADFGRQHAGACVDSCPDENPDHKGQPHEAIYHGWDSC